MTQVLLYTLIHSCLLSNKLNETIHQLHPSIYELDTTSQNLWNYMDIY